MTDIEKIKAYDEALKIAKEYIQKYDNSFGYKTILEKVFSELKESKENDDEKVRKELIDYFKENNAALAFKGISNECVIAWLEKQKTFYSIDEICSKANIPLPYKDGGNAWCILLGDNIQEGVCGFGNTKEEAFTEFLKEAVFKIGELQTQWKPSDEQLEALGRMVNFAHFDEVKNRDMVRILLNELKKLRGK